MGGRAESVTTESFYRTGGGSMEQRIRRATSSRGAGRYPTTSSIPKPLSEGEETFALHCQAEHLRPEREWQFHPRRKFRFDFAFPSVKLAIEIEGAIWRGGRHSRGTGFENDCVKYNLAVLEGWRVLRYSTGMVMAGTAIEDVLTVLRRF
jgi:very-short-patch-repair endonuclease